MKVSMNGVGEYLKQHLWQLITATITIIVAWTILNQDVQDLQADYDNLAIRVQANEECKQEIKERLVRLETKLDVLIEENHN